MRLVTGYMREDAPRAALNELTRKTFGFDFEAWVRAGLCRDMYVPFSYMENGRALSNVSANVMPFWLNGARKRYIQIGTVMTDAAYRGRGLATALLREALARYAKDADDVYLFANARAASFYEKEGFQRGAEYQYGGAWTRHAAPTFAPVGADMREQYLSALDRMRPNAAFQADNFSLTAFWTAGMERMFYDPETECFAVAEARGGELLLDALISPRDAALPYVLERLPLPFDRVRLGFTPAREYARLFEARPYAQEDCVYMYLKGDLRRTDAEKLMFPVFSHA